MQSIRATVFGTNIETGSVFGSFSLPIHPCRARLHQCWRQCTGCRHFAEVCKVQVLSLDACISSLWDVTHQNTIVLCCATWSNCTICQSICATTAPDTHQGDYKSFHRHAWCQSWQQICLHVFLRICTGSSWLVCKEDGQRPYLGSVWIKLVDEDIHPIVYHYGVVSWFMEHGEHHGCGFEIRWAFNYLCIPFIPKTPFI